MWKKLAGVITCFANPAHPMKLRLYASFLLFLLLVSSLHAQQIGPSYRSETLQIEQISPHTFVHVSYLSTQDFGKVACNGMVVIDGGEALVFDTPTNDAVCEELMRWIETVHQAQVKAVLATHFHNDCLGGLGAFHAKGVPSYGSVQTIELAKATGEAVPQEGFEGQLILKAGDLEVLTRFMGEGHTRDNVVAYVSSDRVLFGGCLIKEVGASVGYLGDANTAAWSATVTRVRDSFPGKITVIPGHGKIGNAELLEYTIQLFAGK
jgi:metallo-beta-lactamase class B